MKIVAVITPGSLPVPPVLGGSIETTVYDYAKTNKTQKIIIISALAGGLAAQEIDEYAIEHIRIPNKSYHNFEIIWNHEYLMRYNRYIYKTCAALLSKQVDIVHVHNMPHWVPIIRKILGAKVKIILTNHNQKINQEKYALNRLPQIMQAVDRVIYPSQRIAELDLILKFPHYASKVSVIYNGVDVELFKPQAQRDIQSIKQKYGIHTDKILLFVGRLVQEKAVALILQAMPEVLRIEPDARLVIAGTSFFAEGKDTPYIEFLRKLSVPIKHAVLFTGYIYNQELPGLYSAARVFVSPVVWDDPSPKTIYEAAACGTPILATARGGIPEIVVNGESAILLNTPYTTAELAEVIIDLLREPDTGLLLGQAARARMLQKFTVSHIAQEWAALYESI